MLLSDVPAAPRVAQPAGAPRISGLTVRKLPTRRGDVNGVLAKGKIGDAADHGVRTDSGGAAVMDLGVRTGSGSAAVADLGVRTYPGSAAVADLRVRTDSKTGNAVNRGVRIEIVLFSAPASANRGVRTFPEKPIWR